MQPRNEYRATKCTCGKPGCPYWIVIKNRTPIAGGLDQRQSEAVAGLLTAMEGKVQ